MHMLPSGPRPRSTLGVLSTPPKVELRPGSALHFGRDLETIQWWNFDTAFRQQKSVQEAPKVELGPGSAFHFGGVESTPKVELCYATAPTCVYMVTHI